MHPRARATVEDLYRVPENGKAELIDGEIVTMPPTGGYRTGEDYFAAGTLVVWDVADAEPALPGWTMLADDLLP